MIYESGNGTLFRDEELAIDQLGTLPDSGHAECYSLWRQATANRQGLLPARGSFHPEKAPHAMGRIAVWAVCNGGADFEMLLRPSKLDNLFRPSRGLSRVSAIQNMAYRSILLAHFGQGVRDHQPHIWRITVSAPPYAPCTYNRLCLPFSADGNKVDHIYTLTEFSAITLEVLASLIQQFDPLLPAAPAMKNHG